MDEINTEAELEQEGTDESTEVNTEVEESKSEDPIDKMTEEELRAKLKADRAIKLRHATKEKEVKPQSETSFLTKDDFYRSNTRKAKLIASEADKEIAERWDEIIPFVPSVNRGQETAEDILENMRDGYAAWSRTNRKDSEAPDLATIGHTGSKSAPVQNTPVKDEDPRFSKPSKPDEWYPKKS